MEARGRDVERIGAVGEEVVDGFVGIGESISSGQGGSIGKDLVYKGGELVSEGFGCVEITGGDVVYDFGQLGAEGIGGPEQEAVVGAVDSAKPFVIVAFCASYEVQAVEVEAGEGDAVVAACVFEQVKILELGGEPGDGFGGDFIFGYLRQLVEGNRDFQLHNR